MKTLQEAVEAGEVKFYDLGFVHVRSEDGSLKKAWVSRIVWPDGSFVDSASDAELLAKCGYPTGQRIVNDEYAYRTTARMREANAQAGRA